MPKPKAKTAKLLNARGRVTLHKCVRLEKRGPGRKRSLYPIYRCTETSAERDFGYLPARTPKRTLKKLFPGVPVFRVNAHSDEQAAA